jgi:hypothetical protein
MCEQISLHLGGYLSDKEVIVQEPLGVLLSRLFLQAVLLQLGLFSYWSRTYLASCLLVPKFHRYPFSFICRNFGDQNKTSIESIFSI